MDYRIGQGGDFASIGAAMKAAKPGDEFFLLTGVYNERLVVEVADTIWQAEPGHDPLLDGGWNGHTIEKDGGALFAAKAPGVTIRGLRGRNSKGPGIAVSASKATINDVHVFNCYKHGFLANGPGAERLTGLLIENCSAVKLCQGMAVDPKNEAVGGGCTVVGVFDSIIRWCVFGDCYKELFNIDRGSQRVLIYGCIGYDSNHGIIYFNCSSDNTVENCVFYLTYDDKYRNRKNGNFPACVIFGDERGALAEGFPRQKNNRFINNVVGPVGRFVEVRNNAKTIGGGYNTILNGHEVSGNSFIAGSETSEGITIDDNAYGLEHLNSIVRDNVFEFTAARPNAVLSRGGAGDIEFSHNAWSTAPIARMRGDGDVVGDLRLVNPAAAIVKDAETCETDFDVANYRPAAGSPLIGASTNKGTLGALEPGEQEPPDDEEPPVDMTEIAQLATSAKILLGEAQTQALRLRQEFDLLDARLEDTGVVLADLVALVEPPQE